MSGTQNSRQRPILKIFLSSPGDVNEERVLADRVMRRLADRYAPFAQIAPVIWEHEPLLATSTFQDQIEKPSSTDIVVCILWSRLGTRLPAHITRDDGSRYDSGTEFEFEDAWTAMRNNGRPDLLVYRKMAEPMISLSNDREVEERLRQKRALDGFIQKWFHDQDGSLLAAFHAFRNSAEFEDAFEVHLDKLIQRRLQELGVRLDQGAGGAAGDVPDENAWQGSPFRGLEAFEFEHAPIFYGRTKAVSGVLDALRRQAARNQAFVLVLGRSGGGKSSLARAGVIPLLVEPGVVEGVGLWRRAIFRPSEAVQDIFDAFAASLTAPDAMPELLSDGTSVQELAQILRSGPNGAAPLLKGALSQAAQMAAHRDAETAIAQRSAITPQESAQIRQATIANPPQARLVLLIDQLEELFTTQTITVEQRLAFVDAIAALARSGRVFVLATLRSDFYDRCSELPELVALKDGDGQFDLLPPSAAEIAQIIRLPARRAGLRFDEHPETGARLDDVLRDVAANEPDSLPLLEFTLAELYQARGPGGVLTWDAYDQLGGVAGALGKRAEDTFDSLGADAGRALPHVMRQIVHVGLGRDEQATKRQTALRNFPQGSPARTLIDQFIAARLFVVGEAEAGEAVVTLTHEALLTSWPRLQRWLDEDRTFLRIRARLAFAVDRWVEGNQDTQLLLPTGVPLEEALQLRRESAIKLSENEAQFIQMSEHRAARGRRLKQAAAMALAVLTIVASGAAFYADGQRRLATSNALSAEQARVEAVDSANVAREARANAEDARRQSEVNEAAAIEARALADSARLAAETSEAAARDRLNDLFLDQGRRALLEGRVEEATLVLGAALVGKPDAQTSALFGQARDMAAIRSAQIVAHVGQVVVSDASASGYFATGSDQGDIAIWDAATGQEIRRWRSADGTDLVIRAMAFSERGDVLAAGLDDGSVLLWRWAENSTTFLFGHFQPVTGLVFAPDGQQLASLSADKTTRLWDVPTGRVLHVLVEPAGAPVGAGFLQNQAQLAIAADDGSVGVWDLASGRIAYRREERPENAEEDQVYGTFGPVLSAAFVPDQNLVILASGQGSVTALPLHPYDPALWQRDMSVQRVSFDPATNQIIARSGDRVSVIALTSGQPVFETPPQQEAVTAASPSGNGDLVAVAQSNGQVHLFNGQSGRLIAAIAAHDSPVSIVQFTDDGSALVTGSLNGALVFWTLDRLMPCTLSTEGGRVVAFSPDGSLVASGDNAGNVRLTHTGDCTVAADFSTGTGAYVQALEFAPDGLHLAVAAGSKAQVIDTATGTVLWQASAPADQFMSTLAYRAGGAQLVVGHRAQQLWDNTGGWMIHDATSGQVVGQSVAPLVAVSRLEVIDAPEYLVSQGRRGLDLWWPDSGRRRHQITQNATSWVFWPQHTRLAVGDDGGQIRILRHTSSELLRFDAHGAAVTALAVFADADILVSGAADGDAAIWEASTGRLLASLRGHEDMVGAIGISPDGDFLVSAARDGSIILWDSRTGDAIRRYDSQPGPLPQIAMNPDGSGFAVSMGRGRAQYWPLPRGVVSTTNVAADIAALTPWGVTPQNALPQGRWQSLALQSLFDTFQSSSLQADEPRLDIEILERLEQGRLASVRGDALAVRDAWADHGDILPASYSVAYGANEAMLRGLERVLSGHADRVEELRFSPDGQILASVDWTGRLIFWNTQDWTVRYKIDGNFNSFMSFAPDGRFAIGDHAGATLVLDPVTGQELLRIPGGARPVWSADGGRIAAFGRVGPPDILDPATGALLQRFTGFDTTSASFALSADFSRLAVIRSGEASVIDPITRDVFATLRAPQDGSVPEDIVFSPQGDVLAVIWSDQSASLHDTQNGQARHVLPGNVASVQFSPDSKQILVATTDDQTSLIDVETGRAVVQALGNLYSLQAFLPDGQTFATAVGPYRGLLFFARDDAEIRGNLVNHATAFVRLATSPDGKWIVTSTGDGHLRLWDTEQVIRDRTPDKDTQSHDEPGFLAADENGRRLRAEHSTAYLVAASQAAEEPLVGHLTRVLSGALGRDKVLTASADGKVLIWDAMGKRIEQVLDTGCGPISALALAADGAAVFITCGVDQIQLLDLATTRVVLSLPNPTGFFPDRMQVAEDGRALLLHGEDRSAAIPLMPETW